MSFDLSEKKLLGGNLSALFTREDIDWIANELDVDLLCLAMQQETFEDFILNDLCTDGQDCEGLSSGAWKELLSIFVFLGKDITPKGAHT